ncbi:MAG TPA: DUF4097 family beta strand repeat-containing protein, partial [Acidobacteriaceae bacterium]|nr:DUF4097 family beta strand repeat-containing protein [Acidobacteriaceae bacterium]
MASTPPSWTSREARWQAKQAARAQRAQWKAQMRAQKDYYRSYWRGWHRPTFVGPLILLTIGVIALLMSTGKMDPGEFWSWYARWWPLLLIVMGGLLLGEHFLDWNRPWAGRRSMGGIVWLVILMICLGWVSRNGHLMGPFSWEMGDDNDNFWNWMGQEHDNDVQIDQVLTAAKPLITIDDPQGDVTITPSGDNQMHLRAHQMVHRNSDSEAQKLFEELKPKVEATGGGAVITVPEKQGARVDLTVELPAASYATVKTGRGDVTADGLTGGIQVSANHGEVKLEDIGGDAEGHISHGDFSAHNVQGRVLVDGLGDDVTLSQIQGPVTINGEFFGDIHLEQIAAGVHFHSNQTTLEIPHLMGSMTLDKSDLSVSQAGGPVRVLAKSKDIDLTQIAGDIHIEDTNGDVNIVAANPLGNLQITDHTGNVIVTMPENGNFTVTGSTSADEAIRTDFPLKTSTDGGRQTLAGSVGHGGVQLQLETEHGNLELRKGDATTVSLTPPKPPTPPEAPGKHFKAAPGTKSEEE